MKAVSLYFLLFISLFRSYAQLNPDIEVEFDPQPEKVVMPPSPLKTQILFIGGYHEVQTVATYGNPAGKALAKQWHDFIGFTPDTTGSGDLGWVTVNHEMIQANDKIGDGGGMTVFKVKRDSLTDTLIIVEQTLTDGRAGKFFNVDFANTVGETGMNCGGITSTVDGRIWTAEEWWRSNNYSIAALRDKKDFTITGSGITAADGQTIKKYQNFNWMVEIDPREAKAIRKQYNWGRQPFEGGIIMPDNRTVYLSPDVTPAFITKFVAKIPGDFTIGKTYVYKHNATSSKWVEIDNSDLNKMLNFKSEAEAAGATMFNRLEWAAYNLKDRNVYFSETGTDYPGASWADEYAAGAVFAEHHIQRAITQGTQPQENNYRDHYGRILKLDVQNDKVTAFLEGGPDLLTDSAVTNYPDKHFSNPDGLTFLNCRNKTYMVICEDLIGTSYGRVPKETLNKTCELFLLDMDIQNPTADDLIRISIVPVGAEVTGVASTPDGKTLLVNSQHPATNNPFPYNNSLTYAITGWTELSLPTSLPPEDHDYGGFMIYPNPTSRDVYFNKVMDVGVYNSEGKLIQVVRNSNSFNTGGFTKGMYYLKNNNGEVKALVIQ